MLEVCKLGLSSLVLPPRGLSVGVIHDSFLIMTNVVSER